jgi:hypothetical protein
MAYLEKTDFEAAIRANRLDQLIDENDSILESAVETAESEVVDALCSTYNVAEIFSQVGESRYKSVMQWMRHLAIYYMYERAPDELVPARVIKNYDDTKKTLESIARGKMSVNLPRPLTEDGKKKTAFRWGSVPARGN